MMDELGVFPHNASNCSVIAVGDTLVGFDEYATRGATRKFRKAVVEAVSMTGKPVPGAIVELMYKGRPVRHEMTNRDGKAGFLRVIPAEYGIRANVICPGAIDTDKKHSRMNMLRGRISGNAFRAADGTQWPLPPPNGRARRS